MTEGLIGPLYADCGRDEAAGWVYRSMRCPLRLTDVVVLGWWQIDLEVEVSNGSVSCSLDRRGRRSWCKVKLSRLHRVHVKRLPPSTPLTVAAR